MSYVRVKKRRKSRRAATAPDWRKIGMKFLTVFLTLLTAWLVIWMVSCERPAPQPSDETATHSSRELRHAPAS